MPQGLQTFDASGNVILDTTNFLGRILGIYDMAASTSSSHTVPNPGSTYGTRRVILLPMSTSFTPVPSLGSPGVPSYTLSGTTLSYVNSYAYAFKMILVIY